MSYSETEEQEFFHFNSDEEKFIEKFLESKGHYWDRNTVCGNCCGMFADEYWVNGIGGNFPKKDKKELASLMKKNGYNCSIGSYTISADPDDEEEYQIKN